MFRKCLAALLACFLAVGTIFAEEIKGLFKELSEKGDKITITVDDKEKTYDVKEGAMFKGKKNDQTLADWAKGKKSANSPIVLTVEDGKVTEVKRGKKE